MPDTPVAAVPDSLNVHASFSDATFDDEIRDPTASLVLPRSPFGYAHDPAGWAAPENVLVVGAGCAELHPATTAPQARLATASASGSILRYPAGCPTWITFCSRELTLGQAVLAAAVLI
jgi:hypothetical protein